MEAVSATSLAAPGHDCTDGAWHRGVVSDGVERAGLGGLGSRERTVAEAIMFWWSDDHSMSDEGDADEPPAAEPNAPMREEMLQNAVTFLSHSQARPQDSSAGPRLPQPPRPEREAAAGGVHGALSHEVGPAWRRSFGAKQVVSKGRWGSIGDSPQGRRWAVDCRMRPWSKVRCRLTCVHNPALGSLWGTKGAPPNDRALSGEAPHPRSIQRC